MSQISFDRETGEQLERAYSARDILRRRAIVHRRSPTSAGQRILDVGGGPGFYVAELAGRWGTGGLVVGVDRSTDMLDLGRRP